MSSMRRSIAVMALFLFVACLGGVSSAAAATNHPLIGTISHEDLGQFEQLIDVCGVAVDSKGDIYVADYYENRIVVLDADEKLLTEIDGVSPPDSSTSSPDGPCDLAVDNAGRLYVNDYHHDVVRFTPSEFPPTEATQYGGPVTIDSAHPTGVAVDPAGGDVYVDDRTQVAVYDSSGAPVLDGGEPLRIGLGSIGDAYGVAVSGFPGTEGRVYVADAADETVKVYDPALDPSSPVEVIHGGGAPQGRFNHLSDSDLAVDPADGHLYVADNLDPHFEAPEAAVYEFSAAGHYRGQLPKPVAEGERARLLFDAEPSAVAVAKGDVYVTSGNYEDAKVLIFGPSPAVETHLLTVTKTGTGSGTVTSSPPGVGCGPDCVGEFEEDTGVSLKAIPDSNSLFAGWIGCDTELAGQCQVTMSADRAATAQFEPAPEPDSLAEAGDEPPAGGAFAPASLAAPAPATLSASARLRRKHHRPKRRQGRRRHGAGHHAEQSAAGRLGPRP